MACAASTRRLPSSCSPLADVTDAALRLPDFSKHGFLDTCSCFRGIPFVRRRQSTVAASGECLQAPWLDQILGTPLLETYSLQQGGGLVHSEMWNLTNSETFY